MKKTLWFEASMLALVLVISLLSVAVEQYFARQGSSPTHVASSTN